MLYRKLGSSDLEVSEISLGSWLTFAGGVTAEQTRTCTEAAFDAGINFFDTANVTARARPSPPGATSCPRALTWEAGERSEWRRSTRWHVDVSVSSGFERRERVYPHTVENSGELARFAAHHRPFYERLYEQRLDVTPGEQDDSS